MTMLAHLKPGSRKTDETGRSSGRNGGRVRQLIDAVTLGPIRRRREIERRLRELDRLDRSEAQAGASVVPSRSPRGQRVLILLVVVLTAAFTATWFYDGGDGPGAQRPEAAVAGPARGEPDTGAVAVRSQAPPPGVDEATGPLRVPEPAPPGQGGYAFEATQADGHAPVTWDPCRPIRYAVHGQGPAGGQRLIESAVAEISAASGMVFVPIGATDELPETERVAYQPQRYGERWAPVVIAWSDPARTAELAGDVIGMGGGISVAGRGGHRTYVSGAVWLDEPQFADALAHRPAAERLLHAAVMHELGHVLGLDHVDDPAQVMYPEARLQATRLGDGDRRGLGALWQGRCAPDV